MRERVNLIYNSYNQQIEMTVYSRDGNEYKNKYSNMNILPVHAIKEFINLLFAVKLSYFVHLLVFTLYFRSTDEFK